MSEERATASLKRKVAARAGHRCEYCQCPEAFSTSPFCVEHVQPSSRGGATTMANLALACGGCNAYKADHCEGMDPLSGRTARLFNPRQDRWDDHFAWASDFVAVVGRTSIGRVSIEVMRLNRRNLINLRKLLFKAGEHPPA